MLLICYVVILSCLNAIKIVFKHDKVTDKSFFFLIWWFSNRETPDPIPNSEVKLVSADGTRKGRVGDRQFRVQKVHSCSF